MSISAIAYASPGLVLEDLPSLRCAPAGGAPSTSGAFGSAAFSRKGRGSSQLVGRLPIRNRRCTAIPWDEKRRAHNARARVKSQALR